MNLKMKNTLNQIKHVDYYPVSWKKYYTHQGVIDATSDKVS